MIRLKRAALVLLLISTVWLAGCNQNFADLWARAQEPEPEPELIRAKIIFTDDQSLTGYIKSLGVEENGKVYVGGSSLNYLYDVHGNIIGSYNYQRVLYIKILPDEEKEN